MHTMELKDGRTFTPITNEDVLDQVYEYMGKDMYDFISEKIVQNDMEAMMAEKKFNSDYRAMEFECERWHNFVEEISNQIEDLMDEIEDSKITKAKIYSRLNSIHEELRGEL